MTEEDRSMEEKMRGRIAAGALLVFVLVAMAVASGASAACPNEAFRTGPSAFLPECRAYEQVTPVDKESGEGATAALGSDGAHASASGDGIYFHSYSAYGGQRSSFVPDPYLGTRLGDDWAIDPIGPPAANNGTLLLTNTFAVSDDLSLALVGSQEALAPGAIPGGSNLYLRDNRTGSLTVVMALADETFFNEWANLTGSSLPFVDATADWSHILLVGPEGLYDFTGGQLRLVVPEGERAAGNEAVSEIAPNQMSADGSRFFYYMENRLYLHRQGQEPLLVSEDEEGVPISFTTFLGATPDGEVAFFRAEFNGLYRFEAAAPAGSRVERITPPTGLEGNPPNPTRAILGGDATHIYFSAPNRLTADAAPIGQNEFSQPVGYDLYVWQGTPGEPGRIRYIGNSELETEAGPLTSAVSPDGRFFGFEASGGLTPDVVEGAPGSCIPNPYYSNPPGRCSNVFLYSYDTGRLACVTCSGSPPTDYSRLGGKDERSYNPTVPRAVLDDGTIFFDTSAALVPRDVNGARDVYGWRDGVSLLLSGGTSPTESAFVEATPDGSDVFFTTSQPLVGRDTDTVDDLYDARVDGGLPQDGTTAPQPCVGESSCRGATSSGPSPQSPASEALSGAGAGANSCLGLRKKAQAATRRSNALARRARSSAGRRAKDLRKRAAHEAKIGTRLGRRAHECKGGAR